MGPVTVFDVIGTKFRIGDARASCYGHASACFAWDVFVGFGGSGIKERRRLVVAMGAWLALRPREVAPGVGDSEDAKRRRPDGDLHEVLSPVR